jgi:hypothetical protein
VTCKLKEVIIVLYDQYKAKNFTGVYFDDLNTKCYHKPLQKISVAEPEQEPVKRPLFAGAGAQVFRPGSGFGYVKSYKMLRKVLNFSKKNFRRFLNLRPFYARFKF